MHAWPHNTITMQLATSTPEGKVYVGTLPLTNSMFPGLVPPRLAAL